MNTLRKILAMVGVLGVCLALTHCASARTCYNGEDAIACREQPAPVRGLPSPITPQAKYAVIYTPATIYRSWVNRHLSAQHTLIDAHDVYWVGVQGHWNVPIATPIGTGAALLGPAGAR